MKKIHDPHAVFIASLLGAITGILVGFVGGLFQIVIHWMGVAQSYIIHSLDSSLWLKCLISAFVSTLFLVLSLIIVRRFAPEASGSGVQEIEGVLVDKRSMRWWKVLPVKFFAGVLSLSSGLVLGREGPTIQMGGALGQMVQKLFRMDNDMAHILIAAGAGAGLATAFNAPLAGVLFVIEEMHSRFRYSFRSIQAVIIACVCADIFLRLMLEAGGYDIRQMMDIDMTAYGEPSMASLWLFVIFGIAFGGLGVLFNRYLVRYLNFFSSKSGFDFWKWIVLVGITTGILLVVFPDIVGGGYHVIPRALHGDLTLTLLISVFVLRLFTTWTSYGTGVPGGIFAPMLALGTLFGMFFGILANLLFPDLIPNPQIFAVAGMSALFSATVSAPLTGIVLVVEMTMNYALILPLILTCFSATITAIYFGGTPIYETLLARTLVLARKKAVYLKKHN
ncbi:MAG: H(+)/Cl(-) exchange transporter ClcA [Francisellaceae bacterium]